MTEKDFPVPGVSKERRKYSTLKKTLLLAAAGFLLLVAGSAVGAGTALFYFQRKFASETPPAERIGRTMSESIAGEFSLAPGEKDRIDAIIKDHTSQIADLRQEYGDRIGRQFEMMCCRICEVLGPERSRKWEGKLVNAYGERASQSIHGWKESRGCMPEKCPMGNK